MKVKMNVDNLTVPQEIVDILSGEKVRIWKNSDSTYRVDYYEPNQEKYSLAFKDIYEAFEFFLTYGALLGKTAQEILDANIEIIKYSQRSVTERVQRRREEKREGFSNGPSLFDFIEY